MGLVGVVLGIFAAWGGALHGAGQQLPGLPSRCIGQVPVKKQLGRHRQHLLTSRVIRTTQVEPRGITAGLGALQGGEQGAHIGGFVGIHRQRTHHGRGEIDLVHVAALNGRLNGGQRCVKCGARQTGLPGGIGCGSIKVVRRPRQGLVIHGKTSQRSVGGVHAQGGVKGSGGFVPHAAHTPQAAQGSLLHRVQQRPQLAGRVRCQRLQRLAEGVAQTEASVWLLRVRKVNQRGDAADAGNAADSHQAAPMPGTKPDGVPTRDAAVNASIRSIGWRARRPSAGSM